MSCFIRENNIELSENMNENLNYNQHLLKIGFS